MKKLLLAAVAALSMIGGAEATTMNLRLQQDGGAVSDFNAPAGTSSFSATNQVFGDFLIANITGSATPSTIAPTVLSTNTLNIQTTATGPHILNVWITANDLTAADGAPQGLSNVFSGFTNVALSQGWIVTLESLFSSTNAMFAGALIDTDTFVGGAIPGVFASQFPNQLTFGPAPYSLTAHYTILTTGIGQANSGISIAASEVPLPAAAWLFLGGLGMVGLLGRRRKAKQATQA